MEYKINKPKGHFKPEEVESIFSSLMGKLVRSESVDVPGIILPLVEFLELSEIDYVPDDETKEIIKKTVERRIRDVLLNSQELNLYAPVEGLEKMCQLGIVAKKLGIDYDLNPEVKPYHSGGQLITPEIRRDLEIILNFELHHFKYENENPRDLRTFGTFLPLDLIYFAELNGIVGCLEGRTVDSCYEAHNVREVRVATKQEALEYAKSQREKNSKKAGDEAKLEAIGLDIFEKQIHGEFREGVTIRAKWEVSDGVYLCHPDVSGGDIPRKPLSTRDVREYLGNKLEKVLAAYCELGSFNAATEIIYRRNKVKDFLGGDINIPPKLAEHDATTFRETDPKKIISWIDEMVGMFGPSDTESELSLPLSLTKQEYRLYRTIRQAIIYVRRGALTYDTPEKKNLMADTLAPYLTLQNPLLGLPTSAD